MMRIMVRLTKAATVRGYRSKSRAKRRLRLIQAKVRSSTAADSTVVGVREAAAARFEIGAEAVAPLGAEFIEALLEEGFVIDLRHLPMEPYRFLTGSAMMHNTAIFCRDVEQRRPSFRQRDGKHLLGIAPRRLARIDQFNVDRSEAKNPYDYRFHRILLDAVVMRRVGDASDEPAVRYWNGSIRIEIATTAHPPCARRHQAQPISGVGVRNAHIAGYHLIKTAYSPGFCRIRRTLLQFRRYAAVRRSTQPNLSGRARLSGFRTD